ncbi:MAG TPA: hypothetical protein VN787_05460, partial [Steroidobacteraceae bacterium]|nr:hypothetical protein [Steroidobacteraceae bacterium]
LSLPRSSLVLREHGYFSARLDVALAALGATGFDVVFDAVLGEWFAPCFERLAPEGRPGRASRGAGSTVRALIHSQ